MTPAERLIAQIKAQRLSWVELEPAADGRAAKRVQITRPPETAMPDFVAKTDDGQYTLKAEIRHVNAYTVGWEGFIESDLVGPAGASDPVDFAPELWQTVVAVATLTGGTACWMRCGRRSTVAGCRRRIRTAAWRSTRSSCPDTTPLVYVPYLTGADPGSKEKTRCPKSRWRSSARP